mmetsp:Transcript_69939/g.167887  ORF Transcript_69939/g.167887 Transcript_69939/m.167887 type:complete len:189 (+) Transcript_69939:140-706(+)|eukprot:CAMPEP_0178423688 /NCGR_PEP_ID=MMETSP0689_2-20121128/27816_1 /TAXON_ID=160604 /ORGANISM="Amphidinium massartii, Strain CS-259" /LENGTH=188 /DNA_ID=CAMNT_0020045287 /DNA_START=67 /DNA_END=633 /DNA_ORIENTATION=-
MKLATEHGLSCQGLRLRRQPLAALLLLLLPTFGESRFLSRSHAALKARSKGIFWKYDAIISAATCECSCCIVEPRRPAEADGAADVKCAAPSEDHRKKSCDSMCATVGDQILDSAPIVSLERFCFYKCKPEGETTPNERRQQASKDQNSEAENEQTDTSCVGLSQAEQTQNLATDGNGRDGQLQASTR